MTDRYLHVREHAAAPRIALLLPNLRPGGAERVAVNIANSCVKRTRMKVQMLQKLTS